MSAGYAHLALVRRQLKRLSNRLKGAIESSSESHWLSPISVWELGMLVAHGRLRLNDSLRIWVRRACAAVPVRDATLTQAVGLRADELAPTHPDPADRMIAATALTYELTLITADGALLAMPGLRALGLA